LLRLPGQAPGYPVGTFIFTYGTTVLGMTRDFLLVGVLPQTALGFMRVTIAGRLLDVIGRKRAYMSGCVIMAIFGFVYYVAGDPDPVGRFRRRGDLAYSGQELVWT
jgi:MFS family permease